jgi:tetratricopeptide (TPR) repeat protein
LRIYEMKYYLHKHPSLVEVLRQYIRDYPESRLVAKTKLRIALLLYEQQRYYQSLSAIDELIEDCPDKGVVVEAMMLRARVSQAMNNNHELMNSLRALLLNESASEYRLFAANELAGLWVDLAAYDSALFYYNLLLASETYRENAIMKIANIYELLGQPKEAVTVVGRLVSEYPKSIYLADAYMLQARALKSQGDYDSAIEMLHKISEEITDRADLFMELGNLYFDVEEFVDARDNFIRACEIFKQDREDAAQALLRAGDASVLIGDKKSSKEYYLKASMIAESPVLRNQAMQKLTSITKD